MPRYFSSVLRILSGQNEQQIQDTSTLTICGDGKSVALPKQHGTEKPFKFDRVYFAADDNTVVYKGSVKEIVEGSLLGYHGTIISTGERGLECGDTLLSNRKNSPGVICKAADHVFVCIKRSKGRTGSSLVVLCSYLAVINEKVYDLLRNYENTTAPSGEFPLITCKQGQLFGQSAYTAKNSTAILKFLNHGENVLNKLKEELNHKEDNIIWHTIFTLTVEHGQFGAQFAPVSGTLSFVQLSSSQQQEEPSMVDSYSGFVAVINQLASMKLDLKSVNKQPDYHKSVLTEILRESLGGNCRTLLITHVNFMVQFPDRMLQVLSVGSKACAVHNQPNKRDLAEQALMSAYMKELRQIYGNVSAAEETSPENQSLQVPASVDSNALKDSSQTSVLTAEIDDTYDELMRDLQNTGKNDGVPKRFVEMAASALAEAALEGGNSSSESDDDPEEDATNINTADEEPCSSKTFIGIPKKDKGKGKRRRSSDSLSVTSGSTIDNIPNADNLLISSLSVQGEGDKNVCEALAAILQDPDRGAHRVQDRKNIKIRKDVGALFSGADIVQWMLGNLDGLSTSEEAEKLGQLLLDQNAILHSEGSRIFANAESLYYYVHRPREAGKMLSHDQVAALLAHADHRNTSTNVTVVKEKPNSSEMSINAATTPIFNCIIEQKKVSNSDGMDDPTIQVDRSFVKEISRVEILTSKLSIDPDSVADRSNGDDISDVLVLSSSGEKPSEGQHEDHIIQDHVSKQPGSGDHQQPHGDSQTEELGIQRQVVPQLELGRDATTFSSNLTDKAAPPIAEPTHSSSTSPAKSSQYMSQTSMFAELQSHNATTSSSSIQAAVKTGRVAPWYMPGQQGNWSHDDHVTSKSSGLSHLQGYKEEEEELVPDDDRRSYMDVPNVAMTTNSAEIEDFDNVEDYPTPLHMAAALGKKDGVIANLSMMYAVDNEDDNGRTPLMYATIKNKVRSCQALINCGAKVDQVDHTGSSALHYAACLGYYNVIGLLLSKKAIPFLKDSQGQTALHLATVPASTAAVQIILKSAGIQLVTAEDNHKLTPIHWAIAFDHSEQLKTMIKSIGDPTKPDSCGRSLLNYSLTCKSVDCSRLLASLYPSMMGVPDIKGLLPIHVASMQESTEPLTVLLQATNSIDTNKSKQHFDLNATDSEGKTALHWSALYNRKDTVELLLKHGASKHIKDQGGMTPLDTSRQQHGDNTDVVKLLQQEDVTTTENSFSKKRKSKICVLI